MALSRQKKVEARDALWYEEQRHENQRRNMYLLESPDWCYCDADSFYRAMFPEGFLQSSDGTADGKPNVIVLEDTGIDRSYVDEHGDDRTKRIMHRYTVHDDLNRLNELRGISVRQNTFMFLAPISYYGKSRDHRNARYLHAFMIDLDYVGERELRNLLHQMKRGVIPYANYLVSSGTGLHVVYMLERPIPLMTRYVAGLQAIKYALTERVWNANTSNSDPDKKQHQGIYQGFRMVGTATKLNGDIGKPKFKQPYVVEAFSHDATPPATIPYLLSFLPELKNKAGMGELAALSAISKEARKTTPMAEARKRWPEWYENTVVRKKSRSGWTFGRAGYDDCLKAIREQVSVSHRYWCIFYLAVMANKCGVSYEELEDDAYSLLKQFDDLSVDPSNRFTAHDVAAALEAYEDGRASGRARRYTKAFCERHSAVSWKKRGTVNNPLDKRLPPAETLEKARAIRDLHQKVNGTNWWDNGNRDGAPDKAMLVWQAATEHPEANHSQIAKIAGVSRPTVVKWLKDENWPRQYEHERKMETDDECREAVGEMHEEPERMESESLAPSDALEHDLVETVAASPWKTDEEIAAMYGLRSVGDVRDIVEQNRDLYDRILIGFNKESRSGMRSEPEDVD